MADNVQANAGSGGATFATDDISSVHYPRNKVVWGEDGTATDTSHAAPLPTETEPRLGLTTNVHQPSSNTAAIVTKTASGGTGYWSCGGVYWSYDVDPTAGSLKIEDGSGNTVLFVSITAKGPGFLPFTPPLRGTANTAMIFTLAAGGTGVTGKVTAHVWSEG